MSLNSLKFFLFWKMQFKLCLRLIHSVQGLYGKLHLGYHQLGQVTADKSHQEPRRRLTVGHKELSCGNITFIPLAVEINTYLD